MEPGCPSITKGTFKSVMNIQNCEYRTHEPPWGMDQQMKLWQRKRFRETTACLFCCGSGPLEGA